jgi:hypothetical protein
MRLAFLGSALALGLLANVPTHASEMTFRWVEFAAGDCRRGCPRVIEAQGAITTETPRAFREFIAQSGDVPGARRAILIHSPGGVLRAGMELGMMFRRLDAAVFVGRFGGPSGRGRGDVPVAGACVSACVYAFLGGTARVVPTHSRLGVHRPYRAEARADASPGADPMAMVAWDRRAVEATQRRYIRAMGADPALVGVEQQVPSTSIRFLAQNDLRRLRIVTRAR